MIKKRPRVKNKKYLNACRDEFCYLAIPGICSGGTETTVPAHSNEYAHDKGMSKKADDIYTVPACYTCHQQLDQGMLFTRKEKFALWRQAYEAWKPVRQEKLKELGL